MAKLYKVNVFQEQKLVASYTVEAGGAEPLTGSVIVPIQQGSVIELVDQTTGMGPKRVAVRRVDDNLEITFDEESMLATDGSEISPDLVLQGFYGDAGVDSSLLGIGDGGPFSYIPVEGQEGLAGIELDSSGLFQDSLTVPDTVPSATGWYALALPIGAAAIAIASSGGGGSSSKSGSNLSVEITSIDDDTGIKGDFVTSDTSLTVNGTLSRALNTGEKLQLSIDGGATWNDVVVESGETTWSFEDTRVLQDDTHVYTVRVVNFYGKEIAFDEQKVVVDTTPPSDQTSVYIDTISTNTSIVAGSLATSQTPYTMYGRIGQVLNEDEKLQYQVNGSGPWIDIDVAAGSTQWHFIDNNASDEGTYRYEVRVVDLAGNVGQSANEQVLVVKTPPTTGISIDSIDDLNPGEFATNKDTVTLHGTLSAPLGVDEFAQISLDGTTWITLEVQGLSWSYTDLGPLVDGERKPYVVRVVDLAGNQSMLQDSVEIIVDMQAPEVTVTIDSFIDNVPWFEGDDFQSGTVTNDTTPELKGSLVGDLEANEAIHIFRNNIFVGTASVSGNEWRYQEETLEPGTYVYYACAVDYLGNQGAASANFDLTVDLDPPPQMATIISFTDDLGDEPADYGSGVYTMDNTPTFSGSVDMALDGSFVAIYRNGEYIGNAEFTSELNWTYQETEPIDNGLYLYTARVVNSVGNESNDSAPFRITIDTPHYVSSPYDDQFWLVPLLKNTIVFNLLDQGDPTGGNGSDIAHAFTVGDFDTNRRADRIDLSELLDYDVQNNIHDFVRVQTNQGHTVIQIDRDGASSDFDWATLVTLRNVQTDLETLLANNQLVVI